MPDNRKFPKDALILLSSINKLDPKERTILLSHLDDSGISALSGLIFNLLYNKNVQFPPKKKQQIKSLLKENIQQYRKLADSHQSFASRKKIIQQKGGFISALISAAVPLIAQLIAQNV